MSPKRPKKRDYELDLAQKAAAKEELVMYLDALCHDPQFSIRRACRLIELLELPKVMLRAQQIEELERILAIKRNEQGWGRPWNKFQLHRVYYAKADFRQGPPKPVTRAELERWIPKVPPNPGAKRKASGA